MSNEKIKTLDEALSYAKKVGSEFFDKFETVLIAKNQEMKDGILRDIQNQIKQEISLFPIKTINNKEDIKNTAHIMVEETIGKLEIEQILKIPKERIEHIDNKFHIAGAYYDSTTKDYERLEIHNFSLDMCKYPLHFDNCKFTNMLVEHYANNCTGLSFVRCEFLEKIDIYISTIKIQHTIQMKECIFHKEVKINNKIFNENVYFNNSTFKDYVDFHESEFVKTACFYGVNFEKVPNFSQAIFNGNLNLVNTRLNFDFKECKKITEIELKRQKKQVKNIPNSNIPTLHKVANDFRDSFRIFKNALIKENNLLDASNYHKIELYFKEIELKHKKPLNLSEKIDLWLLKFYRCACSHHTNLLQAFNSLIILIGVFAILNLVVVLSFNCFYFGFFEPNPHALFEFYNAHIKDFVVNDYILILCANFALLLIFVGLFLCSIFCSIFRKIALAPCYFINFILLISSPKYLIPAISIFTDKRLSLDPLSINGGLYTISFGFMIYSFVKTARRNSIVPA